MEYSQHKSICAQTQPQRAEMYAGRVACVSHGECADGTDRQRTDGQTPDRNNATPHGSARSCVALRSRIACERGFVH